MITKEEFEDMIRKLDEAAMHYGYLEGGCGSCAEDQAEDMLPVLAARQKVFEAIDELFEGKP